MFCFVRFLVRPSSRYCRGRGITFESHRRSYPALVRPAGGSSAFPLAIVPICLVMHVYDCISMRCLKKTKLNPLVFMAFI